MEEYETPTLLGHNVVVRETARNLIQNRNDIIAGTCKEFFLSEPSIKWRFPGWDVGYKLITSAEQAIPQTDPFTSVGSTTPSDGSLNTLQSNTHQDYSIIKRLVERDGVIDGSQVGPETFDYLWNGNQDTWDNTVNLFTQKLFPGDSPHPFDMVNGINQYAYLGAQGPDFPYYVTEYGKKIADIKTKFENPGKILEALYFDSWFPTRRFQPTGRSIWADMAHYCKSGMFIVEIIDIARTLNTDLQRKVMAYTLGHICHIATDAILHPFVNSLAGAYYNLSVDHTKVMKYEADIVSSTDGFNIPIDLHHLVEFHMDAWLAQNYYGRISVSLGEEWTNLVNKCKDQGISDVLSTICKAYTTTYGHKEQTNCFNELMDGYNELYQVIYDVTMKIPGLPRPIPQHPEQPNSIFIEPGAKKESYPEVYENRLKQAVNLAEDLSKEAVLYFKGQISKDEAKKRLGCYNLDTGYNLRVKKKRKSAVIEFQHSWSKYGAGPVNQ